MKTKFLIFWILLCGVCGGQAPQTITDLRLRDSSASPGEFTFRHNGDGVLKSYNSAGVETAAWDSETGEFSGAFAGTVSANNITAGTLQTGVNAADGFGVNLGSPTGTLNVGRLAITADDTGVPFWNFGEAGILSLYTITASNFQGSGFGLHDLNASALDSGTVPVARIPTAIPATRIGSGLIDNTEFGYLNNVSSNIQTQLNAKAPIANPTFTGTISGPGGGITNLNASNLANGTLPDARLSANVVKYNDSSPLVFNAGELQLGGNGNWATNGGIAVHDSFTVDTWRLSFRGNQNRWEFDRAANVYTAGNFIGGGSQLTGIPHFTGNNTWTGSNNFTIGAVLRGLTLPPTVLYANSANINHTIISSDVVLSLGNNSGSYTINVTMPTPTLGRCILVINSGVLQNAPTFTCSGDVRFTWSGGGFVTTYNGPTADHAAVLLYAESLTRWRVIALT